MTNYFEVLHVDESADIKAIKKAYRALAKKYHPDSTKLSLEESKKMMILINEAYQVLSDADKREKYLQQLHSSAYTQKEDSNYSYDSNHSQQKSSGDNYTEKTSTEEGSYNNDSNFGSHGSTYNNSVNSYDEEEIGLFSKIIAWLIVGAIIISIICCIAYFVPDVLRDTLYMIRREFDSIMDSFR
jgi:curved DNA-binding protein CbpA